MGNLDSAKNLGGIGSILIVVGALIPAIGTAVAIVGIILVLIAVKYISDETKDPRIFKNYLFSFIFAIVAFVVAGLVLVMGFFGLLLSAGDSDSGLVNFLASIGLALVAFWILAILSAVFLRRSYNSIHAHTKVSLFSTTATVNLIGAFLVIVLIGLVIVFIAMILQIVAFFSLPEMIETQATSREQ